MLVRIRRSNSRAPKKLPQQHSKASTNSSDWPSWRLRDRTSSAAAAEMDMDMQCDTTMDV